MVVVKDTGGRRPTFFPEMGLVPLIKMYISLKEDSVVFVAEKSKFTIIFNVL